MAAARRWCVLGFFVCLWVLGRGGARGGATNYNSHTNTHKQTKQQQGKLATFKADKATICFLPPAGGELTVTKTATFALGMQPGTASWNFAKSVALPPPYTANAVNMFNGDRVDALWTLSATKAGADSSYQGQVTGQIILTNPTKNAMQINGIVDQVQAGPGATVTCPQAVPFTVAPCSFVACSYVASYATAPAPGSYSNTATVSYQVLGGYGYPATAQGAAAFNVGFTQGGLQTSTGTIAAGTAQVNDPQAPQPAYVFTGSGVQTYQTTLQCPATATVSNQATLTGANGQQIVQSASVQKNCFSLLVQLNTKASQPTGKFTWSVKKTATPGRLSLRPEQAAAAAYYNAAVNAATGSVS